MKSLLLAPKNALYTENLADPEKIEGTRLILEDIRRGEPIREPVYVMRLAEFNGKYAIFNGNRRTKAAELSNKLVSAFEIESEGDFQIAQANQPTSWHILDEEDFLRHNGEYFYKDVNQLKQKGLFLSAYHRARKRIRDAVNQFYSWM